MKIDWRNLEVEIMDILRLEGIPIADHASATHTIPTSRLVKAKIYYLDLTGFARELARRLNDKNLRS